MMLKWDNWSEEVEAKLLRLKLDHRYIPVPRKLDLEPDRYSALDSTLLKKQLKQAALALLVQNTPFPRKPICIDDLPWPYTSQPPTPRIEEETPLPPSEQSVATSTPFPLLALPRELRNEVYRHLLTMPIPTFLPQPYKVDLVPKRINTSILRVNKQIHDEATEVLYGSNTFAVYLSANLSRIQDTGIDQSSSVSTYCTTPWESVHPSIEYYFPGHRPRDLPNQLLEEAGVQGPRILPGRMAGSRCIIARPGRHENIGDRIIPAARYRHLIRRVRIHVKDVQADMFFLLNDPAFHMGWHKITSMTLIPMARRLRDIFIDAGDKLMVDIVVSYHCLAVKGDIQLDDWGQIKWSNGSGHPGGMAQKALPIFYEHILRLVAPLTRGPWRHTLTLWGGLDAGISEEAREIARQNASGPPLFTRAEEEQLLKLEPDAKRYLWEVVKGRMEVAVKQTVGLRDLYGRVEDGNPGISHSFYGIGRLDCEYRKSGTPFCELVSSAVPSSCVHTLPPAVTSTHPSIMATNDDNKWRRRQSTQGGNASPSPSSSSQSFNQPRRSDSRSDRSSTSFNQSHNNRSYGGAGGSSNFNSAVDEHTPVNGFNGKEVRDFLAKGYQDALNSAQSPGDNKPVVWKNSDKGWTTQSKSSPWAPNKNVMANGTDFLTRLKKGVASPNTNGSNKDDRAARSRIPKIRITEPDDERDCIGRGAVLVHNMEHRQDREGRYLAVPRRRWDIGNRIKAQKKKEEKAKKKEEEGTQQKTAEEGAQVQGGALEVQIRGEGSVVQAQAPDTRPTAGFLALAIRAIRALAAVFASLCRKIVYLCAASIFWRAGYEPIMG
ncbi:hypothetical protein DRE_01112 [Drechslerella stenobrocha 248]|uniref:F-box domain-containing protein n=1 Tax=Drechslerella stenobrocha 248 TaxID=1043628 RepID=W7HJX9_9PEZI|nr:hypothetical protein DRE_01112 [Drechslerella stenobrocha 248]